MFWRVVHNPTLRIWQAEVMDEKHRLVFVGVHRLRRQDAVTDLALYLGQYHPGEMKEFNEALGSKQSRKEGRP